MASPNEVLYQINPTSSAEHVVADADAPNKELRTSSYCIFVRLPDRRHALLVHGYTGAYDEVDLDVAAFLYSRHAPSQPLYGKWSRDFGSSDVAPVPREETIAELQNRGYLTTLTPEQEREYFRSVADRLHSLELSKPLYILVPTYDCNLRCSYCFQDYMRTDPTFRHLLRQMTTQLVDRMLSAILEIENRGPHTKPERRRFTFFGGEPLLAANRPIVEYIIRRASELGPATFGAVTNGTDLEAYLELLGPAAISSLQITLDGPPVVHDRLRVYADGQGSFERIARNISRALERSVTLSIRVNVSRRNIEQLSSLVMEARQRGWADYERFRMYAAPVHPTPSFPNDGSLFNSSQLSRRLQQMREADPAIRLIGSADDSMKARALRLFQDPEIDPIEDFKASFCGAHSGMYVFDPFGDIYACWEKLGDPRGRIGHVGDDGALLLEPVMLHKWRSRTVASNPICESCAYAFHCGGGCAVLAEALNGEYFSNYCDGFAVRFKTAVAHAYEAFITQQISSSGATQQTSGNSSEESTLPCH